MIDTTDIPGGPIAGRELYSAYRTLVAEEDYDLTRKSILHFAVQFVRDKVDDPKRSEGKCFYYLVSNNGILQSCLFQYAVDQTGLSHYSMDNWSDGQKGVLKDLMADAKATIVAYYDHLYVGNRNTSSDEANATQFLRSLFSKAGLLVEST